MISWIFNNHRNQLFLLMVCCFRSLGNMLAVDTSQQLLCNDNTNTNAVSNVAHLCPPKPCVEIIRKQIVFVVAQNVLSFSAKVAWMSSFSRVCSKFVSFLGCGKNFRGQTVPFSVKTKRFIDATPPTVLRDDGDDLSKSRIIKKIQCFWSENSV